MQKGDRTHAKLTLFTLCQINILKITRQTTNRNGEAVYAAVLVVFMLLFKQELRERSTSVTMREMARIVFTDKVFLYLLLGNLFVAGAYSHLDTTLAQYIGHDRIEAYSFLFVMNTVSVLVFQYPLARLMKRYSAMTALKLGCLLFGLGLFGFGLFTSLFWLAVSMVVFTIGEIAPEHLRGTYYGASGFAFLGQSVCAWIGGLLLQQLGFGQGPVLFAILMLLTFLALPFFQRGQRLWEQRQMNSKEPKSKGCEQEAQAII